MLVIFISYSGMGHQFVEVGRVFKSGAGEEIEIEPHQPIDEINKWFTEMHDSEGFYIPDVVEGEEESWDPLWIVRDCAIKYGITHFVDDQGGEIEEISKLVDDCKKPFPREKIPKRISDII